MRQNVQTKPEASRSGLYREAADALEARWDSWVELCRRRGEHPGSNEDHDAMIRFVTLAAKAPERVPPWGFLGHLPLELVHRLAECRNPLPCEAFAQWIRPGDRVQFDGEEPVLVLGRTISRSGCPELRVLREDGTERIKSPMPSARVWILGIEALEAVPVHRPAPADIGFALRLGWVQS